MKSEDEDTDPEIADPVLFAIGRIEGKIDTIIMYLKSLERRVAALEYDDTAA
jgi:hypothetical protein